LKTNEVEINLPDVIGKGYASFWHSKKRYRVLKGGRGSKKSATTGFWYIYNIMKYKQANAVVIRKTFSTHKDSTFAQLKWAAKKLGVFDKWKFTVSPLEATYLATGQKILFRGLDDPLKLTSMTVDTGVLCWVWWEEVYEIEKESDFDTVDESIRGEMPEGLWKQLTLTYNPWVNSHWTKERFWDNTDPNAFTLTTTYKCNEWLDDQDRSKIEALATTNPERYKVVGLGDYGIPGGTFFEEFRTDIHVIDPFVLPAHWQRFRFLDYGLDMLAHYWGAIDTQGFAYIYKEIYEPNVIISAACKKIKAMTNETIKLTYAPPDLWKRNTETGKAAADIFRENGIMLTRSNNDRVDGWLSMKEWLAPFEIKDEQTGETKITARLKIFKNCVNLIRTLPQIQHDEVDPNDCRTEPHELTHAPDALRYFTIMRLLPSVTPKPYDEDEPTPQDKYNKMVKSVTGGSIDKSFFRGG
jgi:phage terminase large subunit